MITIKEKDQLVTDVINRLKATLPSTTDFSDGSVLKTLIESIMAEIDIQYFQVEQVYNGGFIDYAIGSDLDKLVSLLGVTRIEPVKSIGTATFYRATNAAQDYFIASGTSIQTLPDSNGLVVQFITTEDAILLEGTTSIDVEIEAVNAGLSGNVPALTIKTINNPSIGIESVKNNEATSGGTDIETDEVLRNRTKHVLDAAGLGTIAALFNKISAISGVKEVSVQDMARGIGTVDILVLADTIPMIQSKKDEINNVISETKAGGIDILLLEPTVINTDVTVTLTMDSEHVVSDVEDIVSNAIMDYIDNLNISETLILNQLRKYILNSSSFIIDILISTPTDNITIESDEIIRTGTITIG